MKDNFKENDEGLQIIPESELWPMPADFPEELKEQLGGEEDVQEIYERYFGPTPINGWTLDHARAMVNCGRRKMYEKFKQGHLPLP